VSSRRSDRNRNVVMEKRQVWLIVLILLSTVAQGEPVVIGNTFDIAEPDVLEEIKARASTANLQDLAKKNPGEWSGFQSGALPPTQEARTRWHRPHYVLEQEIADHTGRVLYPKGYAFNPLAYFQLPSRIVVIGDSPDYIAWLRQHAHPLDMVLTAGGDPMALSERYGRPVFLLEPTLRERLAVQVVPSIVQQKGDALSIQELVLHEANSG
jgi:hypothetical protein